MLATSTIQITLLILHAAAAAADAEEQAASCDCALSGCKKEVRLTDDACRPNASACALAALEQHEPNGRSLSPWVNCVDKDDSRHPQEITFARCLCEGCIIDGRVNHDYNSVAVNVSQKVRWKTPCKNDKNKYVFIKTSIKVPVACTCVRPEIHD